jgi:hypothetical protein
LEKMAALLKNDSSLSNDQRSEALADLGNLQAEAGKPKPNYKVARFVLAGLGVIKSVSEQVHAIKSAWGL